MIFLVTSIHRSSTLPETGVAVSFEVDELFEVNESPKSFNLNVSLNQPNAAGSDCRMASNCWAVTAFGTFFFNHSEIVGFFNNFAPNVSPVVIVLVDLVDAPPVFFTPTWMWSK